MVIVILIRWALVIHVQGEWFSIHSDKVAEWGVEYLDLDHMDPTHPRKEKPPFISIAS